MTKAMWRTIGVVMAFTGMPLPAADKVGDAGETHIMLPAWQSVLPARAAAATFFEVFNLHIVAASDSPAKVSIVAVPITETGFDGTVIDIPDPGRGFRLAAMGVNPSTSQLVLAGSDPEGAAMYAGLVSGKMELRSWQRLKPFPQKFNESIVAVRPVDEYTAFITDRTGETGHFLTGYATRTDALGDAQRWMEMPNAAPRTGFATLSFRESVVLLGGSTTGEDGKPKRTAQTPLAVSLKDGDWTSWDGLGAATSKTLDTVVGASVGTGLFLAPRTVAKDDTSTSQTLFMSSDLGTGEISEWRKLPMGGLATPLRSILVEPRRSQLLFVGDTVEKTDPPTITVYTIPNHLVARRLTDQDILRATYLPALDKPPFLPREEALAQAREKKTYVLAIVTSSDEEDLNVRISMRGTQYRYMTQNMVTSYYTGEAGKALVKELGVGNTPAYLVLDPDGKLVKSHVGSVPKAAELFDLTSPSRQAVE